MVPCRSVEQCSSSAPGGSRGLSRCSAAAAARRLLTLVIPNALAGAVIGVNGENFAKLRARHPGAAIRLATRDEMNAFLSGQFLGDLQQQLGALALGGALGTIAVIVRQEIVLAFMGGVFVLEALSVMVQVGWFKYTKRKYGEGRRILLMAPLHHHFEKSGWKETQVVVRFWIITMLLCLVGLSTLKLR